MMETEVIIPGFCNVVKDVVKELEHLYVHDFGREVRELYKKEQNFSNKYGAGDNKMSMVASTSMLWA